MPGACKPSSSGTVPLTRSPMLSRRSRGSMVLRYAPRSTCACPPIHAAAGRRPRRARRDLRFREARGAVCRTAAAFSLAIT
jgi:hypothetical protein